MSNLAEKERRAIERLKSFEPEEGYFLAYSGGKDSDCIKILAQIAGVKFKAVHSLTTVDAPETCSALLLRKSRLRRPHIFAVLNVHKITERCRNRASLLR